MNIKTFCKLFDFLPKSRIKAKQGKSLGKFPFYTSSNQLSKFIDEYTYSGKSLIFGTGGNPSIHYQPKKFATSTDCVVAQPKKDSRIDPQYCYLFIANNMRILEAGFKGAGLKHISKEYISKIKIPLPEKYEDQIRIATLLSRAEALIAKRKESIRLLDELLKSTFLEMFGDPVRNEKGFITRRLDKVATISRGKFTPRPRNDPKYFGGKYPFIQTGDISKSNHRLRNYSQTLNEQGIKVSKEFKKGTVVIAIVGATIGETAILEIDTYATDSVIGIVPNQKHVSSEYLEFVLRFWKPIFKAKAPQAARANINNGTLKPVSILLPPDLLLAQFSQIVKKVESIKAKYEASLKELENFYCSLSQRAFRGELDLSRIPVVTAIKPETAELKLESYAPEVEITKRFSKKELIKFIKSKSGQSFNFDELWNRLDASSFEEQPQYDDVKKMIFNMFEGKNPLLSQSFDKQRKEIVLRVNV